MAKSHRSRPLPDAVTFLGHPGHSLGFAQDQRRKVLLVNETLRLIHALTSAEVTIEQDGGTITIPDGGTITIPDAKVKIKKKEEVSEMEAFNRRLGWRWKDSERTHGVFQMGLHARRDWRGRGDR